MSKYYTDDEMKYMGCSCLFMLILIFIFAILPIWLCCAYSDEIFVAILEGTKHYKELADSVWNK